jgi:anti-sigma factor RsiW
MTSERDAHPDEGTINAWLDRQLDDASSDALEAHLQGCDECAERVAEARGLIAGASRIIASLDDADAVSGGAVGARASGAGAVGAAAPAAKSWGPAVLPATRVGGLPTFRFTPARSAIAAVLVVAVATAILHEKQRPSSKLASVAAESASAVAAASPVAGAPAVAGASSPATTTLDSAAAARVATARTFAKAQRETTVNADRARVGQVPPPQASTPMEQTVAAARAADNAVAGGVARAVTTEPLREAVEAPLCYRVESANGSAASWGPVALPFTLALDAPATRASARVVTADGRDTDVRARFERRGEDSLLFTLQRIGYSGTLAIGAPGEIRAGVMRSAPVSMALGEVVVTSEPSAAEQRRALRKPSAAAAARADSAAAPARDATPAVPVVLRKVACGGRD